MATPRDRRVDVLGVGISVVDLESTLGQVARWIEGGEHHYVCVTNSHGVMESQCDPELLRIHNDSGLTVPDGVPLLWAGRFVGASGMDLVRGPDLLPALCALAAERGWRNYFYGGEPGTPEALAERLGARFPGLAVAGCHSPPFRPLTAEEDAAVVERINASGADLVWVGLSTPKQERWMAAHAGRLDASVLLGVGAAFDLHAGRTRQAPSWIQGSGLEWLYRLGQDPRRLAGRYGRNVPFFVFSVLRRPPVLRPESSGV